MIGRREVLTGAAAVLAVSTVPVAAVEVAAKRLIIPSLTFCERQTETVRDNTRTIFYEVMERWTIRDRDLISIETAKVSSPRYWQWLAEDTEPRNHYPHIGFGGCVVPSKEGDPEFYNRWLAYAKTLI